MDRLISRTKGLSTSLMLLLTALTPLQAAELKPGERLEYTFSYRGILSGFIEIAIARAEFAIKPEVDLIDGHETVVTTVDVSTESFDMAELIYPIRFRYSSWLEPVQQTPMLVQEYLHTDEISEELLWFDRQNQLGYRYLKKDAPAKSELTPPAFLREKLDFNHAEWLLLEESNQQALNNEGVWDYLSMLYRLRFLELEQGKVFDLPLFNGKRIKTYRVEVSQERMQRAGWDLPAFKLSLYELRSGKRKGNSITALWVSDDAARLPLRFYVERSFGVVEGILQTGRPLTAQGEAFSESTRKSLELIF